MTAHRKLDPSDLLAPAAALLAEPNDQIVFVAQLDRSRLDPTELADLLFILVTHEAISRQVLTTVDPGNLVLVDPRDTDDDTFVREYAPDQTGEAS